MNESIFWVQSTVIHYLGLYVPLSLVIFTVRVFRGITNI